MVDWEVLRATKRRDISCWLGRLAPASPTLQLWLLEAMLSASASDEIEAHQLLRLPELFPFSFTINLADLRRHEGFNIHRQGLDMDMVSTQPVKIELSPRTKGQKPKNPEWPKQDQPNLFAPTEADGGLYSGASAVRTQANKARTKVTGGNS